jgi:hypothetical protein
LQSKKSKKEAKNVVQSLFFLQSKKKAEVRGFFGVAPQTQPSAFGGAEQIGVAGAMPSTFGGAPQRFFFASFI